MPLKLERVMFYSDNVILKIVPMEVTLVGIVIDERDEQPENAPSSLFIEIDVIIIVSSNNSNNNNNNNNNNSNNHNHNHHHDGCE